MNTFKQVIELLNNINGGLMIIFGVGINQVYQKIKKWRKKDVVTLDEEIKKFRSDVVKLESTVEVLKQSNLALLHDKLYKSCTEYIENGSITIGERDNLEYVFGSYKALGGNGTGEHLYLEAKNLPTKGE